MPKSKVQTQFKTAHQSKYLAYAIAQSFNRGSALQSKIETVLNAIRENTDTKSLKKIDQNVVQAYTSTLQDRTSVGEITTKTASGYASALNSIIAYTNGQLGKNLEPISAQSNGLSRGSIEYQDRVVSQEVHIEFKEFLSSQSDPRAQALMNSVELQREFGLRLRESLSIKQNTIKQALKTNELHLSKHNDGTKNSQARTVPITTEAQRQALRNALNFMRENQMHSLIPTAERKEQYSYAENIKTKYNHQHPNNKMDYHGERHFFAQNELSRLTLEGHTKEEALQAITEALGHHREEILKHYIPM